jgi:DNA-binding response OmpR family regulator
MAATARSGSEVIEVGPLEILPEEHLARAGGRVLVLSIRELRLLTELGGKHAPFTTRSHGGHNRITPRRDPAPRLRLET